MLINAKKRKCVLYIGEMLIVAMQLGMLYYIGIPLVQIIISIQPPELISPMSMMLYGILVVMLVYTLLEGAKVTKRIVKGGLK